MAFIGPWEIETQETLSKDSIRVTFKEYTNSDGLSFLPPVRDYTKKTFDNIVSDDVRDYNDLRDAQYNPLIEDVLSLLSSYDINIGTRTGDSDLEHVFRSVLKRINEVREDLEDKYWGVEENEKTLRQLFSRWKDHKDTEIRKLTITKAK